MADPIRELVLTKLKERGLHMRQASLQMKRNHAYLQQFIERGSPAVLPEDARELLAPLLGIQPADLRPGSALLSFQPGPARPHSSQPVTPERIPVLGMGEGGDDGWEMWNGDVVETIPRPVILLGVAHAYAIYVTGTSMEPRYEPGQILYIHPAKPLQIGNYVLVERFERAPGEGPRAVIKRLVKKNSAKIVLEQFNPPRTFDVKAAEVRHIHRIVGTSDG